MVAWWKKIESDIDQRPLADLGERLSQSALEGSADAGERGDRVEPQATPQPVGSATKIGRSGSDRIPISTQCLLECCLRPIHRRSSTTKYYRLIASEERHTSFTSSN